MSNKKWIFVSLIIILTPLLLNYTFLFIIDTYGVASPKAKVYYTVPNQRYLIVEHLLKNKVRYDTLIFGSSRVGRINPLKIKNKKAYNMTYGEGIPHEHLLVIKLLIKQKLPIKHILIGLDDFSYQVPFSKHQNQLMPKSHYLATNESIIDFYKFYFFRKIDYIDIKQFKNKFLEANTSKHNIKGVYTTIFKQEDRYLNIKYVDNNNSEYINNPRFKIPTIYSGNLISETIEDIKEIVKITKENNIELTIFINPIHHTTYKSKDKKLFQEFRDKLSYITEYYDFSKPNTINNNNAYWKETSHYSYRVGDMILNRIYNNDKSIENFGIYINKEFKN